MFDLGMVWQTLFPLVLHLLGAIAIMLVGRGLAGIGRRGLALSLQKTTLTASLNRLFVTLAYYAILTVTIMLALIVLGIPATTVVGVVGIVLVIIAIALQQSLGDLAATINFLLFKPFEVNDFIESAGIFGVVREVELFTTELVSPDNKTHVLPNSKILQAGLTNYSRNGTIRVDLTFRIGYESDAEQAKQILSNLLIEDARVLSDPPPYVFIQKLAESHVELAAWPYVQISDYLSFQTAISQRVWQGFKEAGIVIPFPQQEVHLVERRKTTD